MMLRERADQQQERRTESGKPAVSHQVLWPPPSLPSSPPPLPQPRLFDAVLHEIRYLGLFVLPLVISLAAVGAYFVWGTDAPETLGHDELMQLMTESRQTSTPRSVGDQSADRLGDAFQTTLFVSSEPRGALVLIDGDTLGTTPIEREDLAAGVYVLTIEKTPYASLDTVVFINQDDPAPFFHFALTSTRPEPYDKLATAPRLPDRGMRSTESASPSDTPGGQLTTQHLRTDVELSTRTAGSRTGASSIGQEARSTEPGSSPVVESARPNSLGTLTVLIRPWGTIYVDGRLEKLNTDVKYTTSLPLGRHVLRAEHPVLGVREQVIEIRRERPLHVVFDLIDDSDGETESQITSSDAS